MTPSITPRTPPTFLSSPTTVPTTRRLQAARNIEEKIKPLGIPMTLLVAPGLKHEFPAEWQKKAEAEYEKYTTKGRPDFPAHVHFVTYTLKYPSCDWVEILGLDHHYQRALVDAEWSDKGATVKTENVCALHLGVPRGALREAKAVAIDGQNLEITPYQSADGELQLYLEKRDGKWDETLPERLFTDRLRKLQKVTGLQGPIDDAFTNSFLCVLGRGKPWNDAVQQYAEADLKRFKDEWSKYLRGNVPVKYDDEVTPADIATHNLILFGDPGSNRLLAQALPGLPLRWTKDKVTLEREGLCRRGARAGADLPQPILTGPLRRAELRPHVPRRGLQGHERPAVPPSRGLCPAETKGRQERPAGRRSTGAGCSTTSGVAAGGRTTGRRAVEDDP